jgi:ribosomal protein S18 acetylase RimI-like enzyme
VCCLAFEMNNTLIRKATKSDLPVIGKLLAELIDAMDNTEGIDSRVAVETCSSLLKDASSHFLVAETEGSPVGFISFATRNTVLHQSPSALIDELVVAKEYQGKGIGKQLVLAAIEKCKQLGCCEVEVSTEKTNAKARKFYKKCGFNERGILFEVDL